MRRLAALLIFSLVFSLVASGEPLEHLSDAAVLEILSARLRPGEETTTRSIKRLGHHTIEMETLISTDGEIKIADRILSDFDRYPQWVLQNINRAPGGGDYYVHLDKLFINAPEKNLLTALVTINLPLFKASQDCQFRLGKELHGDNLTITAMAIPNKKSVLESMEGYIKILPAPHSRGWIWAYVKTRTVIKNWLLYEALPEKVLGRESADRLQTVLDNYHREEDKFRAPASLKIAGKKRKRAKQE